MADFDQAALGIKTEQAGDVAVKIVDATVTSQQLAILADGSIKATVAATDLDIRDLNSASDSVTVTGNVGITGTVPVTATDLDIRNLSSATDSVTVTGAVTVSATDLDIRNLSSAQDNVAADLRVGGNAVAVSNPVPVVMVSDRQGDEINDYNSQTVAVGTPVNHDYTVSVGKTLLISQIECSASGKARFDIQVEGAVGVFATKFTKHNSVANPDCSITLQSPLAVAAGKKVRIVMTNRENQSQDLTSTISGQEV